MNQDGIEHVSYTIMDLRVSPSGKYLLAATDSSRNFIFEVRTYRHLCATPLQLDSIGRARLTFDPTRR